MNLVTVFAKVILANELGGDRALAYKFSDPDGIRTGKSGWSFGLCQFDTRNNPQSIICLRGCGFTTDEIAAIKAQTCYDMPSMDRKLAACGTIVDRYDDAQLGECLQWPAHLARESGIKLSDGGLIACADYHNQYYMSRGGKLHTWLKGLGREVKTHDILDFKLEHTVYGKKRPNDCIRRYNNITEIMREETP